MRRERLTEKEVRAAVRERGIGSLANVEAVVLETAGELSVIARTNGEAGVYDDLDVPSKP